jgi:hypothetical protein
MKCTKVKTMMHSIQRYLRLTWGLDYNTLRLYYNAVIIPALLYGASAWISALRFKCVSTPALIVLSNCLPIDLKALEIATLRYFALKSFTPSSTKAIARVLGQMGHGWAPENCKKFHSTSYPPWSYIPIPPLILLPDDEQQLLTLTEQPHLKIFIDGSSRSHINTLWINEKGEMGALKEYIPNHATVFQAECLALNRGLKIASAHKRSIIFGNCRPALTTTDNKVKINPIFHRNQEYLSN